MEYSSVEAYPSSDDLEIIRIWPDRLPEGITDPYYGNLMDFIKHLWWSAKWEWTEKHIRDYSNSKCIEYHISTGGWSGNEDIIRAMQKNSLFWALCWEQSRRGGHYTFTVPDRSLDD